MSESTLSTTYDDLREAIAHYLGFGLTSTDWSTDEAATIAMILKRGLRQFYFPPRLYQTEDPHEWNFLKPTMSLDTIATYSTGTIAVVKTGTTVTLTTGVWPSWAYTHGTLVVDTTEYAIASRTSDAEIELSAAWTEDTETAATYDLKHDGNYDLPDDFGGMDGTLTYEPSENKADIKIVGEGRIRTLRRNDSSTTYPLYVAIRPKEQTDTTTGQRFEVMFYPIPDDAYELAYRMNILPQMLVATTLTHPYGGAIHAETIEASCLAIAELQEDEKEGPKKAYFMERLSASISKDKNTARQEYFGYNGDQSQNYNRYDRRRHCRDDHLVTYDGGV